MLCTDAMERTSMYPRDLGKVRGMNGAGPVEFRLGKERF